MAGIGDLAKGAGGVGPALLIGVGAFVLGPPLLRMTGRMLRPVAKKAVRTGAAARESFGDLIADSRSEMGRKGGRPDRAGRAAAARPGEAGARP